MLTKNMIVALTLLVLTHLVKSSQFTPFKTLSSMNLPQLDEDFLKRTPRETQDSEDEEFVKLMNSNEEIRGALWSNIITEIAKRNLNISIVGWQNIYDNEGNIEKVVALELAFPVKDKSKIHLVSKDDGETAKRSNPHKAIRGFGPFVSFAQRGLQVDIFALEHKRNSEVTEYFYWNPHTTYYRHDNLVTFNKTQFGSYEDAKKLAVNVPKDHFTKYNRPHYSEVEGLVYGADGILNNATSFFHSGSVVSYVIDFKNVTGFILVRGPMIMADVAMGYGIEEIPEQLAKKFNEEIEGYDWRVLVNPGDFDLVYDVSITLSTDAFDFYDGPKDIYLVYGVQIVDNHPTLNGARH
jgi:hypothetical protein